MGDESVALQGELDAFERLLWSGLPQRGVIFHTMDFFMIPFSLVWCGFIAGFDYALITGGPAAVSPAIGIAALFSVIGLYMLVGRFVFDALRRARTVYGVTNQRIIILTTLGRRQVKSLDLRTLTDVSMVEQASGRGTITFGPQTVTGQWATAGWPTTGPVAPSFEGIRKARAVYATVRQAQRGE